MYLRKGDPIPETGKGSKLSKKMMLFVSEYQVDWNARKAVARAGYITRNPDKIAAELLEHPLVTRELDKILTERGKRMEIKADYLVAKLIKIIEATQDDNPQAALRAIELAGKSIALWKERQEISGPDGESIRIQEQRVQEDVADFKSRIASVASRGGTGDVLKFPIPRSTPES